MREIKRAFLNHERGQALLAVLVLMVVGGIIIAPFLYMSSTTLKYTQVTEKNIKALYAVDAGIEYGYWSLVKGNLPYTGALSTTVNGMTVNITTTGSNYPYTISATATSGGQTVLTKSATADNGSSGITLTYN